ncbi:unnamed protein product [Adineta ricciae]|uniref:WW domain-containing protein n=1 Tax=Adineta ricciae TaxID=249248 RepID=A0A813VCJ6_ADIRI|nr:unnamed protein product [Adineta ricciae]CAF1022701.1 unnamed protein product [Adineta ricciae]
MSKISSSSYIIDDDQNRFAMDFLFAQLNTGNGTTSKPYSDRNLPASFFRQPSAHIPTKDQHAQHTKNQRSLPGSSAKATKGNDSHAHSRTISDSAVLNGQVAMSSNLSQNHWHSTALPLPDGWEEKLTDNGQIFYIDHFTRSTTWNDPRPNHYAKFRSYCASLQLPDDYVQKTDGHGRVYFMNVKTKQTSLVDPRPTYYHSLMTKRFDVPSVTVPQTEENLAEKLTTIAKERQALQQRTQELERLEAELQEKMLRSHGMNNLIATNHTTVQSLPVGSLAHKRYESTDSGLGNDYNDSNELFDTVSNFSDNHLFPDSTDFRSSPMDTHCAGQTPHSTSVANSCQMNTKAHQSMQQWSSSTRF